MGAGSLVKKTAVVLLNLGGPSSEKEIYPFLLSLFYDPSILSLPNPFRYGLAKFIAARRFPEAKRIYAHLSGGSPLLANTITQATAVERGLGKGYRVFVAMRHAPPFISDVFQEVVAYAPDEIILCPLTPQYSTTTTESFFKEWDKVAHCTCTPTRKISSYPTLPGFVQALKELTLPYYTEALGYGAPQVLLTAHGLPEKIIKKGDPYQRHIEETAQSVRDLLSLPEASLCYQSRVGPLRWIGPSLEEEICKAASTQRPLVIVPLSFVSEHSETLVELDLLMRDLALEKGCPHYGRVPTVGIHPLFIEGLVSVIRGQ